MQFLFLSLSLSPSLAMKDETIDEGNERRLKERSETRHRLDRVRDSYIEIPKVDPLCDVDPYGMGHVLSHDTTVYERVVDALTAKNEDVRKAWMEDQDEFRDDVERNINLGMFFVFVIFWMF